MTNASYAERLKDKNYLRRAKVASRLNAERARVNSGVKHCCFCGRLIIGRASVHHSPTGRAYACHYSCHMDYHKRVSQPSRSRIRLRR